MNRTRLGVLAGIVLAAAAAGGSALRSARSPAPAAPSAALLMAHQPYVAGSLNATIRFYERRVREDPLDAIDAARLSGLYLRRFRETVDVADAQRAERIARRSIGMRGYNNVEAYLRLAQALVAQHRFAAALSTIEQRRGLAEQSGLGRALYADLLMEVGRYAAAARELTARDAGDDEDLLPVRARLDDIDGLPAQALAEMRHAQAMADANFDMPREEVAWFHMRVGDLRAELGQGAAAAQAYSDAITLFPRDYRSMAGLARLAAAAGDWTLAARWSEMASRIVPAPDVLATLADANVALGRTRQAHLQVSMLEAEAKLASAQGVVFDRQRALYCTDHRVHLGEALALARREIGSRQDIYSWDALAWACYANGRLRDAAEAAKRALARGTKDGRLYYHAGRIAEACGDRAGAAAMLREALACGRCFVEARDAQAALDRLEAGRGAHGAAQ